MLAGRRPRPDRADEVLINASAAAQIHLRVGSRIRVRGFVPADAEAALRGTDIPPTGPVVEFRVVGVGRQPSELSTSPRTPGVLYAGTAFEIATPAFFKAYGDQIAVAGGVAMAVRLRRGLADFPAFRAAVARISPEAQIEPGSDDLTAAAKARRATRLEALALLLFGILAALVALAMVSQALSRQAFVDAAEYPALGAMGMTRGQLVAVAAIRAALIAAGGAVLAVALAIVLSPRMPIGLARQAEVHRGVSVDGLVLGIGAAVILVVVVAAAGLAAWRGARTIRLVSGAAPEGAERPSRVADRLGQAGLPPSTVVGVRMALEPGRGATAVPVRTTLVSAVVAVAVLVSVGNPHSDDVSATAIPLLEHNPDVAAVSGLAGPADVRIDGRAGGLYFIDSAKGSVAPPFLEGREPTAPDEIAFGARQLRDMRRSVGQQVSVSTGERPRSMRIVGRMVLTPAVVNDQVNLGEGTLVTKAGAEALGGNGFENAPENVFLVRFKPGVDRAATLRRLQHDFPGTVLRAVRPADVENLRRVDHLPSLLAALFAAVALLTVGHMLMSSVRRRRHDVAILRTMGFVRRQVSAAVAWQATTVALVGLVVGLPLGLAAGRWAWGLVARQLGVLSQPVVPVLLVSVVVAGALVAANILASLPGLVAARTRPAEILRTE